jgi:hypothetical protein
MAEAFFGRLRDYLSGSDEIFSTLFPADIWVSLLKHNSPATYAC